MYDVKYNRELIVSLLISSIIYHNKRVLYIAQVYETFAAKKVKEYRFINDNCHVILTQRNHKKNTILSKYGHSIIK